MDEIKEAKEFLERNEHLFRQVLWDQLEINPISDQSNIQIIPNSSDQNFELIVSDFIEGANIKLHRSHMQRLLSIGLQDIIIDHDISLVFDYHSIKPYVRRFR